MGIKEKLKAWVKIWSQEEQDNLSELQKLQARIAQMLYVNSFKDLFTKEFWQELNNDTYSCIGEWFFFLCYNLRWVIIVEKDGKEYCL